MSNDHLQDCTVLQCSAWFLAVEELVELADGPAGCGEVNVECLFGTSM